MPEGFLSLIVTMLPAFREIEQRLDRETGRRFNAFNLFTPNKEDLPTDVKAIVRRQYEGVKANHDRIRDLRNQAGQAG